MSFFVLLVAAVLWGVAHFRASSGITRLAAGVHALGVLLALYFRDDLLPSGWASVGILVLWLPTCLAVFKSNSATVSMLRLPFGFAALVSSVWAAATPGPGVALWSPWSVPHIILAVLAVGAAAGAAMVAVTRLRGQRLGLLLVVILLTALPLVGPKASTAVVYQNGEALKVNVAVDDPAGDQGIVRVLPARVVLPWERNLRTLACLALILAIGFTIIRSFTTGTTQEQETRSSRDLTAWIALGALAVHLMLLLSAMIPRELVGNPEAIIEVAKGTLALEMSLGEGVGKIVLPEPPYLGGLGSVSVILPIAILAFGLCLAAFSPSVVSGPELPDIESRFAYGAVVLLIGTVSTGMVWSNYSWGGVVILDPKLYGAIATAMVFGMYALAQRSLPKYKTLPSWLALVAFAILLLSMLGPELGWTAPTLHHFGA